MTTQDIIKLIKLLKPEFYNKITWAVVIAGLALMATPFWEEIIFAVVKKEYKLNVTPGGNTTWGFALVVIGLLYHLTTKSLLQVVEYKEKEKKNANIRDHDSRIFINSQRILNETALTHFLDCSLTDHSYRTDERRKLQEYTEYHVSPENHFIHDEIQNAVIELSNDISELLNWMSLHFWVFPDKQNIQTGGNFRLCMHPHWNIDRDGTGDPKDMRKYDDAADTLAALVERVEESYKRYRKLVKAVLFI